jgi:pimeloyl-ACP methyl ester carboxylesterase
MIDIRSPNRTPMVLVPCFSGAPWNTADFPAWSDRVLVTASFGDEGRSIDDYADVVEAWTAGLREYVLVGDSFGASVSLALAARQPKGLKALVLSGGFARAHVSPLTVARIGAARLLGQPGYRITVKYHVDSLGSHFDPPGTAAELRELFLSHTDARTFFRRGQAVLSADQRDRLPLIEVPTLVLTPEDDRLIGRAAATELVDGIPDAREVVLPGTGHLLRFTHEPEYAAAVDAFLAETAEEVAA